MTAPYLPSPGLGTEATDTTSEFLLDTVHVIQQGVTIANTARDSGNTPTTTLRKGLVLGKVTATGKYKEYNDTASDGTQTAVGILREEVKVVDSDGNAMDAAGVIVRHGIVDESDLIGIDANGKADLDQIIFD